MANQIRVTVVATGLGKPVPVARPAPSQAHAAAAIAPPLTMRMVRPRSPMAPTDYAMLDKPTVQRQRAVGDGLRTQVEIGGFAGYPSVFAPPGGLTRPLAEQDQGSTFQALAPRGDWILRGRRFGEEGAHSIGRSPMLRNVMDCLRRQAMYKSRAAIDANLSVRDIVGVIFLESSNFEFRPG